MGNSCSFVAINEPFDLTVLNSLPKDALWRAFRLRSCKSILIEWVRMPNRNNPPPNLPDFPDRPYFAWSPVTKTMISMLGGSIPEIQPLLKRVSRHGYSSVLPAAAIAPAFLLAQLTGQSVLSVNSGDEDAEVACRITPAGLDVLKFGYGPALVSVTKHDSQVTFNRKRRLHGMAKAFAEAHCQDLGTLFSVRGAPKRLGLTEVARGEYVPLPPSPLAWHLRVAEQEAEAERKKRPWWKFVL